MIPETAAKLLSSAESIGELHPSLNYNWNSIYTHEQIVRLQAKRPGPKTLRKVLTGPSLQREQFISKALAHHYENEDEKICMLLSLRKEIANVTFKAGKYEDAIQEYQSAMTILTDRDEPGYLLQQFYNDNYIFALRWRPAGYRMAYIKLNKMYEAMDWIQEVEVLYECLKYHVTDIDGRLMRYDYLEFSTYRMKAALRYIYLFMELKNTAAAAFFVYRLTELYSHWFPSDVPEIKELLEQCDRKRIYSLRHPDLGMMDTWSVVCPRLQLRGIWNKITTSLNIRPPNLLNFVAWIWRSRLYLRWDHFYSNQLWFLDLKERRKWELSAPYAKEFFPVQPSLVKPLVYDNQVWFFTGQLKILRFNLITETWNTVLTTFPGKWPFQNDTLEDLKRSCKFELYKGQACVYGDAKIPSLFLLLDLTTLRWENLFEQMYPFSMREIPITRDSSISWIVEDEDKLFIMYGGSGLSVENKLYGELYADLWSFSFDTYTWTRERLRGNFPSPREEVAHAYHSKLKKLVLFGGITDKFPAYLTTADGHTMEIEASYLADTFIMDMGSGDSNWKQVITRGFPAWRRGSQMLIDDSDGRIYIYGGMSCPATLFGIPEDELNKDHLFGDLWSLELDIPGHHFDERTFLKISQFKAGPYRRCTSCSKIGRDYFRCQGTCGGKVIYCSRECQRKSWKVHKSAYSCRKR